MNETVEEFLQRKGGVGLLSVLHEGGQTYSEIESEVSITSDTISKRKDEALEIGLIEIRAARRNNRTVNEYHLTDFGEAVTERLAVEGVVSNYHSMRMHQRKVEEKTADVVEWLTENPNHFEHFAEVSEETLIDRDTDDGSEATEGDEERSAKGEQDIDIPEIPEEARESTEKVDESRVEPTEISDDSAKDSVEAEGMSEDERTHRDLSEVFDAEKIQEDDSGEVESEDEG